MKIFSFSFSDKKPDKETLVPEVLTEPLTSSKNEGEVDAVVVTKAIRVSYLPNNRRRLCLHITLTVMVFVILACAAVGAVVFYKHLNKRVYSGVCGNVYIDSAYHDESGTMPIANHFKSENRDIEQMDYFEEGIEVSEVDMYEHLHTPQFDEVQENYVWHDFSRNFTAIVDHQARHCFVMMLDRKLIAPPKDLIDLLEKLMSGYYMPKAKVIRENYQAVHPPLSDLEPLGRQISTKCAFYETFWLEKITTKVVKRSVRPDNAVADNAVADNAVADNAVVYAILSNHPEHQEIYKIFINNLQKADAVGSN